MKVASPPMVTTLAVPPLMAVSSRFCFAAGVGDDGGAAGAGLVDGVADGRRCSGCFQGDGGGRP